MLKACFGDIEKPNDAVIRCPKAVLGSGAEGNVVFGIYTEGEQRYEVALKSVTEERSKQLNLSMRAKHQPHLIDIYTLGSDEKSSSKILTMVY